jgi:hypothetical protein
MTRVQPPPRPSNQTVKTIDPDEGLLNDVLEQTINNLDITAGRYAKELADPTVGRLKKAILTGAAIKRLREMVTPPVMEILRSLMNTDTGFLTDRGTPRSTEKTPYDDETIRNCAIEALLRGAMWDGNEFNIIAGRCYVTQNGYRRKVKETPGLTDLKLSYGAPMAQNGHTVVKFGARWKLNGVADQLEDGMGQPGRLFVVTVNAKMGADALLGKAIRKGLKAVYEQVHGSEHSDDADDDLDQAEAVPASPPDPGPKPETMEELDVQMRRTGVWGNAGQELLRKHSTSSGELTEAGALAAIKELSGMDDVNARG